jgi:uncharacterized membrane protein
MADIAAVTANGIAYGAILVLAILIGLIPIVASVVLVRNIVREVRSERRNRRAEPSDLANESLREEAS